MNKLIGVNEFVRRQTKESSYSYFDGTWKQLVDLVTENFNLYKNGYRDGVILIPVPIEGFYTSMCKIDVNSVFETKFIPRQEGEEPIRKTILKNGKKTKAKFVDVVLYRRDVLQENNEETTECQWEIISINASLIENVPMRPMTIARNMLDKEGGTKAEYTGQEFAEALWFWKDYCNYEGE